MTSESKILTVSYGTFSCTLEGFDNPFDTMKAIAEYFRDLAAQDRHFGAEPPPPDAAMLHRLAEREVSRMVAKGAEDGTALLDRDAQDAGTGAGTGAMPRIHLNTASPRGTEAEAGDTAADTPAAPEPSLQDVIPDGVAAKLARIRRSAAPAAMAEPAAFAPDAAFADPVDSEADLPATADAADGARPWDIAGFEAAPGSDVVARLGALIEDTDARADAAPVHLGDSWFEAGETVEDAAEGQSDSSQDAAEADALAEVEAAAEDLEDLAALDGVRPEELAFAEAAAEDVASEDPGPEAVALDDDALDDASLAAALADDLPEAEPADLTLADARLEDPLPEAGLAAADPAEAGLAEVEADLQPAAFASDDVVAEAPAEAPADAPVEAEAVPEPEVARPAPRVRRNGSRILRLHSDDTANDADAARASAPSGSEPDEVTRLMQQADEVMAEDQNRRRHEALSRLKAAVAATEADRADIDYEAPKAEANQNPYRDDLAEAIQPPDADPEPAPAPEVKPRRKSVTIRPATEPRPGTIRPGMISPPPLVLVSEQRIDRVQTAPLAAPPSAPAASPVVPGIGPVPGEGQPMVALRTGRLTGAIGIGAAVASAGAPARNIVLEKPSYGPATDADDDEDLAEDAREIDEAGFARFAETVGAISMADMLEAAAAYATCVEKRSQFTRPQLMRRMMASAGGRVVSREDGLRSFGTLLRTGRIEKVTRGHYSLAENSPYLAEARRLG